VLAGECGELSVWVLWRRRNGEAVLIQHGFKAM